MARPYGPGKFSDMLDAAVYQASLDFTDAEASGDIYAARLDDGAGIAQYMRDNYDDFDVTEDELDELAKDGRAGVILFEDDRGFVEVNYYRKKIDLDADWDLAVEELEGEEADDEGPVEGDLVVRSRGDRFEVMEIEGRYHEIFDNQREMEQALERKFKRDNFWPSVWWDYERGDPRDLYEFEHVRK